MKRMLALLAAAPALAFAQNPTAAAPAAPAPPPVRVAASSFATVEVHLNAWRIETKWYEEDAALTGPSRIAITYGQPHARGRQVEGGLIPKEGVWRFGANTATHLHTDVDFFIGDLSIPRGDYSLFLQNAANGTWTLIVNKQTGQWGTDYDKTKDFGRVTMSARTMAEPEESLSIYLVPDSGRPQSGYADLKGTLRIKWGKTEVSAPWRVPQ